MGSSRQLHTKLYNTVTVTFFASVHNFKQTTNTPFSVHSFRKNFADQDENCWRHHKNTNTNK